VADVAWRPTADYIENANVTRFMLAAEDSISEVADDGVAG